MPSKPHTLNSALVWVGYALLGFILLSITVPLDHLIMLLNAVLSGTLMAIVVAYGPLLWNSLLGLKTYDRVRQMTFGFALCWMAYAIHTGFSIYLRSSGFEVNSSYLTAAGRYIAIIAAMLQVTAPDFGLGLFHGRSRNTLLTGVFAGAMTATIVMLFQTM